MIEKCHKSNIRYVFYLNDGKVITGSEDNKIKIGKLVYDKGQEIDNLKKIIK